MNKKPNYRIDPYHDPYESVVANMESVVESLPGCMPLNPEGKKLLRLLHSKDGICTEAGEYADAFKRHVYYGQPLDKTNLIEELGDVLWYVALACNVLGVTIREVQIANVHKLMKRYKEAFTVEEAAERDGEAERAALVEGISSHESIPADLSGNIIYLACPLSHDDPKVRLARHRVADHVAKTILSYGKHMIFSPLSHSERLAGACTEETWRAFDLEVMRVCMKCAVIPLDGWKGSIGVKGEMDLARSMRMPIEFVDLEKFGLRAGFPYFEEVPDELRGGFGYRCNNCSGKLSDKLIENMREDSARKSSFRCPECNHPINLMNVTART